MLCTLYQDHDHKQKSNVRQVEVEQATIKQKQSEQASVVEDSNYRIYRTKETQTEDKRQ